MDPIEDIKNNLEKITPVKRCPKCGNLSLIYEEKNIRIVCNRCGFEQNIQT